MSRNLQYDKYLPQSSNSLMDKFNQQLSQYSRTYTTYLENINNFIRNKNSQFADKNIRLLNGNIYYVTKYGTAKKYSSIEEWNARAPSCRSQPIEINTNNLADLNLTEISPMLLNEPCGVEGRNVQVQQQIGKSPPPTLCKQWVQTSVCENADNSPQCTDADVTGCKTCPSCWAKGPGYWCQDSGTCIAYGGTCPNGKAPGPCGGGGYQSTPVNTSCTDTIPLNVAGYCLCLDGSKKAQVECGHRPFNCGEACAPKPNPASWASFTTCQNYTNNVMPLLCLQQGNGQCTPPVIPESGGVQRAGAATCPDAGQKLIKNPNFPYNIVNSCSTACTDEDVTGCQSCTACWARGPGYWCQNTGQCVNIETTPHCPDGSTPGPCGGGGLQTSSSGIGCSEGNVCPIGTPGAQSASFDGGPPIADNYKCCGNKWQVISGPTDSCPVVDKTIQNCSCDWTMRSAWGKNAWASAFTGTSVGNSWGAPYKWCASTGDGGLAEGGCLGGIGGSGCTFENNHCFTKAPVSSNPGNCQPRSYSAMTGPDGTTDKWACQNTNLGFYNGTVAETTSMCDKMPGCRYTSYSPAWNGAYLYETCTLGDCNQCTTYDAGEVQEPCWPNILPGGN